MKGQKPMSAEASRAKQTAQANKLAGGKGASAAPVKKAMGGALGTCKSEKK